MKISKINQLNKNSLENYRVINTKSTQNNHKQNNTIINNSVSEVIGRSLVMPFTSRNNSAETVSRTFSTSKKGKVEYNKRTGECTVSTRGFFSSIREEESYNPRNRSECHILLTDEGVKKVTKTPRSTITQIFDAKEITDCHRDSSELRTPNLSFNKSEIFRLKENDDGSSTLLRYDSDLRRTIRVNRINGVLQEAEVRDFPTGKLITSGERIFDTQYDEESDEYVTRNILTDLVTKRVKYRSSGRKIERKVLYHENSEIPKYIYEYDSLSKAEIRKFQNESGKVYEMRVSKPREKSVEIFKYNTSTGEITEHTEEIYGFGLHPKLKYKTIYNPLNNDVVKSIEYKKDYEITTNCSDSERTGENKPVSIEYSSNGKIFRYTHLQEDGSTPLEEIEYNGRNEVSLTGYNQDGSIKFADYFDRDNKIRTSVDYVKGTGSVASVAKYKNDGSGYIQYLYYNYSKSPINIIKVDGDNNISRCTLDLDGKDVPKKLLSTYFERGRFDSEWSSRTYHGDSAPIGDDKENVLSRLRTIKSASKAAFDLRQHNVRRIG